MKQFSLYQPGDSLIHRLDPLSKILYILTVVVFSFVIPLPIPALITLFCSGILLLVGRVLPKVIPLMMYSGFVLASVMIIQGLYMAENKTPVMVAGPLVFYSEGITYALRLCLRVLNLLGAFAVLVLTTKPADLIENLINKGLSPQVGYVFASILQIIPQLAVKAGMILDAQRCRGLETEGNLGVRVKAFLPIIGPVVINSLLDTQERAMALEVRGFNRRGPRTYLKEYRPSVYEMTIQWGLILVMAVALIWRIIRWHQ
ncbi:MAG TPA: energy-coupling factor transporter transmembrane component T [Bacillota bacterium]